MKKWLPMLLSFLLLSAFTNAQYVNIPDTNFAKILANKYPSCIVYLDPTIDPYNPGGYALDTTCSPILNIDTLMISGSGIEDLTGIQYFKSLRYLNCSGNPIAGISIMPQSLRYLDISNEIAIESPFGYLPLLPDSLIYYNCSESGSNGNSGVIFSGSGIGSLPATLQYLNCSNVGLYGLPALPASLIYLDCSNQTDRSLTSSPRSLDGLPSLPKSLKYLYCENNALYSLPSLPDSLLVLDCSGAGYYDINYNFSSTLFCMPKIPNSLDSLGLPGSVGCVPNSTPNFPSVTVCNPTNDIQHCQGFPTVSGYIFTDYNNNGIKDSNEFYTPNIKLQISNGIHTEYTFTNTNGYYEIAADSIGSFTLSINSPNYYKAVPDSINYNFGQYDTIAQQNFALQAAVNVDSLQINIKPFTLAQPYLDFPYLINYSNTGTTTITTNITINFNNTLLAYNSSPDSSVINNGNKLTLTGITLSPGQSGNFVVDFTVNQTGLPGELITTDATITGNAVTASDTAFSIIHSSFDPNDKEATTQLTPEEVAIGKPINYMVHFQNTGNAYASNIVIADTLSSLLDASSLQLNSSSLPCKTTINGNIIYFELLNISLPDSNDDAAASKGFISFSVKPKTNLSTGSIDNTASIYFDYNSPVATNTATTIIQDSNTIVPLKLVSFTGYTQPNTPNVLLYWATVNEINVKSFVVEQSNDGINFSDIGNVIAKGYATNNYTYNTIANNPLTYYRLKIIDDDGEYTYSTIITITYNQNAGDIIILNNPVQNSISIMDNSALFNNTVAKIFNSQGALVKSFVLFKGIQTIDVSMLPSGAYYIQTQLAPLKLIIGK